MKFHKSQTGKNNFIYEKKDLIIKKFSQNDRFIRFNREKSFYEFLIKNNIENIPKIIRSNELECTIEIEKINGKIIKKPNSIHLKKINSFLLCLMKIKSKKYKYFASDYSSNLILMISSIDHRLKDLNKNLKKKQIFIFDELLNKIRNDKRNIVNKLIFEEKNINKFFFNKKFLMVSPSDFGFHNCIIDANENIYYFDFEFSGKDYIFKLLLDFICQPDSNLSKLQIKYFLKFWYEKFELKIQEIQYLGLLYKLFLIKWSLIIINQLNKDRKSNLNNINSIEEILKKSKKYYFKNYERNRLHECFS